MCKLTTDLRHRKGKEEGEESKQRKEEHNRLR